MNLRLSPCLSCIVLPLLALLLMGHAQQGSALNGAVRVAALPADPGAFSVAEALARGVNGFVPDVVFEAAREADRERLVAGLHAQEIAMAVATEAEALALAAGEGLAAPAPVRVLAFLRGSLVLLGDRGLGTQQAYMLLFALYDPDGKGPLAPDYRTPETVLQRAGAYPIPLHAGARAFLLQTADARRGG